MSKKKKFTEHFMNQGNKILSKKDITFEEKREQLNKLFDNNKSIGKDRSLSYRNLLFQTNIQHIQKGIINFFNLDQILKEDEIHNFIKFAGHELLYLKNIKNKLNAFKEFQKVHERSNLSKQIIESIFENFHQYSQARKNKRTIYYHAGPTNSGKTYGAMQDLIKAENGCYLAPLRLLAWEKYEELKNHHICALITGEEAKRPEGYTHSASTIEMANFNKKYKVAVIDEIQMIGDNQRGWAWTKALISIQAETIYVCGDDSALNLVKQIADLCGDELIIVNHERKSKLSFIDKPLNENQIEKGDAIVVFSRKEALRQKENFENLGFKVSIIYGMMTPEVRKEQAKLFLEGKTDIVVSTDAIGMGLNLPIKRVIFTTIVKFFDKKEHIISYSEIKQIGGRAGRFNLYPEGFVGLLDQKYNSKWDYIGHRFGKQGLADEIKSDNHFMLREIKNALNHNLKPLNKATIGPDYELLKTLNTELISKKHESMNILEFLYFFEKIKENPLFQKADIMSMIQQTEFVDGDLEEEITSNLDNHEVLFKFTVAPVILNQEDHVDEFQRIFTNFFNEEPLKHKKMSTRNFLDENELDLKCIELYQWFKNQINNNEIFISTDDELQKDKEVLINRINNFLIDKTIERTKEKLVTTSSI